MIPFDYYNFIDENDFTKIKLMENSTITFTITGMNIRELPEKITDNVPNYAKYKTTCIKNRKKRKKLKKHRRR